MIANKEKYYYQLIATTRLTKNEKKILNLENFNLITELQIPNKYHEPFNFK